MKIDRRPLLAAFAAVLLARPASAQGSDSTPPGFAGKVFINEAGGVRLHTYLAPPTGGLVTSHLIETAEGLVLVDGQFQPGPALELGRYIAATGRPLRKVLLSHAHPDHWFGFHHLGRPAVHAGPATAAFLRANAAAIVAQRGADSSPPEIAGVVTEGAETVGGVELRYRLVADTEAPEMLVVEVPRAGALIVQYQFYNRVHAVVSRQIDNWVAALEGIIAGGAATPLILAGHGEPASPAGLHDAIAYLRGVQPLMAASGADRQRIAADMEAAFPTWRLRPLLELGLSRSLPG